MARFKIFGRRRKPSLKNLFGVTKGKRRIRRALGLKAPPRRPRMRH
jgi:hypothetical protein